MSEKITPMMQQYYDLKDGYPGFMLFYRMGDFYELFGEQAVDAAAILGITLTRRKTAKEGDEGYPMCGVPFHAAEGYIGKLLLNGRKVALCEQTETPAEAKARRGAKALVKREVVRLYTGGTLTEESMLKAEENNYLSAIHKVQDETALAWIDISTGEFYTQICDAEQLSSELARLKPKEILFAQKNTEIYEQTFAYLPSQLSPCVDDMFESGQSEEVLKKHTESNLKNRAQISVCGALLAYIEQTQTGKMPILEDPKILPQSSFLSIDEASRQGLELTQTLKGERKGSLIDAIDRTTTPSGTRLLSRWIMAPLQNLNEIHNRQEAISALKEDLNSRSHLRDLLKGTTDISRSLSRLTLERGSPRDLASLRTTLQQLPQICTTLESMSGKMFKSISLNLKGFDTLTDLLQRALMDEQVPMLARDGGFIKTGFCAQFDENKALATGGMAMLQELEAREAETTGIQKLRIKYNKVWGYFLEVTNSQTSKIPESWIHRQTTTNAQRYSTTELMELERAYSAAEANSLAREQELFSQLVQAVKDLASHLLGAADALAKIDVLCSAAELADAENYVCPTIDDSTAFTIEAGRHSVVEKTVETYVSNDSELSGGKLWLITGPNMAGKSTFLRQNALITILAHAGLFVPAASAHIGLVDRIFTRIGAADDLAKGQSTFMMEMVETAEILNHATDKSLVILDEIGRGTATYDGLSIAWACVEHLATSNKSRGLFATHYHEMTELEQTYDSIENHHVQVKEWNDNIVFLHKVGKGCAPSSYGVHVGRLAGLPKAVTDRAESILKRLEAGSHHASSSQQAELPLFSAQPQTVEVAKTSASDEKLLKISLDDLSPKQAHDLLYELKGLARQY